MLLTVSDLVVGYSTPVLGPLSFSLPPGRALGIVGANGCGKSTLLKSFYGQARIFSGEIVRDTGVTFACQQQHPVRLDQVPLSVRDYLRLLDAEDEPLPTRLSALVDRRIDTLSGGQYQLLAVWACLASPAQVALLDEPTNNLDPDGVTLLTGWLRKRRPGHSLLLISHDAEFMEAVCDERIDVTARHRSDVAVETTR
ncbi:MAG TPA: ATP-binding cassette domain-containing protein [Moraxellaceae bacterium]|nr:ATP-binding cassette domain-containing protein [Moraxellaceae bacterium]